MEPLYTVGGGEGGGGVIPFRTGGFKDFGLIISLGYVTKKINSKLRRVSQINEQRANHSFLLYFLPKSHKFY